MEYIKFRDTKIKRISSFLQNKQQQKKPHPIAEEFSKRTLKSIQIRAIMRNILGHFRNIELDYLIQLWNS